MDLDKVELIRSAVVVPSLSSTDKDGVLDEMIEAAVAAGRIDGAESGSVRGKIADREALGSTGIGNNVAVPHSKEADVPELSLVFARSEAGVPFQSVDGKDVHLFFMVLAPADAAETHLAVLRWVSMLARNEDFRRFATATADADELRDLLAEMGA